ncbi:MAG: penicillin-binding protein 2 [Patescibacteria group bacterium]|nr:penicillin-binding protein 2 [Patescibacteria group bacterium]
MSNNRLWFVFVFLFLFSAAFSWRLFCLQITDQEKWKAQAEGQQKFFSSLQGQRGDIFLKDKDGNYHTIATNKKIYHAYVSPREVVDGEKEILAKEISSILNLEEDFVLEKLEKDNSFEVLKKNLSKKELEEVRKKEKVYEQESIVRFYPEGEMAAHIIGFVGGEETGQYGVEQYYENILRGTLGIKERIGKLITKNSAKKGDDLTLTVDYNIQYFVEKKLGEVVEELDARKGTVLVGDPFTGEIIALANYPTFDLNNYSEADVALFKNTAVQETFEPGSVFKPIVMAIALEEEAIFPEDEFFDTGERWIYNRKISNYGERSYGLVDMTEIIKKSINTGMAYVVEKIDKEVYVEYLKNFEFFQPTGVDVHGEIFSGNKNFLEGRDINYATSSYGQGIEVNVVHLFTAFSAIANGGRLVNPCISENTNKLEVPERKIISEETALKVTKMMVETVEDGFGKSAKVPGYYIAGKTGTAQVAWSKIGKEGKGYSNETIQGFAGFAPAFDPQFVVIIRIDNPSTKSASVSAAPLFRKIADYIFKYKQIAPK